MDGAVPWVQDSTWKHTHHVHYKLADDALYGPPDACLAPAAVFGAGGAHANRPAQLPSEATYTEFSSISTSLMQLNAQGAAICCCTERRGAVLQAAQKHAARCSLI